MIRLSVVLINRYLLEVEKSKNKIGEVKLITNNIYNLDLFYFNFYGISYVYIDIDLLEFDSIPIHNIF